MSDELDADVEVVVWDIPEQGNEDVVHRFRYCSEECKDADKQAIINGDEMHPHGESEVLTPEEQEIYTDGGEELEGAISRITGYESSASEGTPTKGPKIVATSTGKMTVGDKEKVEKACRTLAGEDVRYATTAEIAQAAGMSVNSTGMVLAQLREQFTGMTVTMHSQGVWAIELVNEDNVE